MSKLKKYRFDGTETVKLHDIPTDSTRDDVDKDQIKKKLEKNQKEIEKLQEKLYADGREGVIILLQAMDAAGKDSTIRAVMSGINPQGVTVHNFKQPSSEELAHDFLWRVNQCIPRRGMIAIFNRSYYEDVLVVKVHEMNRNYHMAERVTEQKTDSFFKKRYGHIANYESYLYDNSYRIVKIFLNVSKDVQKERFLDRIDTPEKNWKFSSSDITERALWDSYQQAYEDAINHTATKENPWYILPADQKWYTRYLVSEAILHTLREIDPQFPVMPEAETEKLAECREKLINE